MKIATFDVTETIDVRFTGGAKRRSIRNILRSCKFKEKNN